jgi:YggT family protein
MATSFSAKAAPHGAAVNRDFAETLSFSRSALTSGPNQPEDTRTMQSLYQILMLILDVAWFIMIAHIIMSWLISFQVLNLRQPLVAQLWTGLNRLLEPIYAPIRRFLPNTGGLDLAPLVAFIGLIAIRIILQNNYALFL